MAQTGFTPIQLYSSSTATNVPLAANLATGELAINITDGKLFYKDNTAAVQVIGWKVVPATAGGTGQTSYAVGDLLYANTTTTLAKLPDVATGNALISGGVGVAPSYGKIGLTTHVSGTLGVGNGGTGTATAFTAGSVVFAGSSGIYSQDNTNFYWDDTNNSLGLGTATPVSLLELQSAAPVNTISNNGNVSTATGTVYSKIAMRSLKGAGAGAFANDDVWIQSERANLSYSGDVFTHDSQLSVYANTDNRSLNPTIISKTNIAGITAVVGNFIVGTSGNGLDFSATSGTGTSELLNDYEEGTWTPNQGSGLTVVGAFSSSGTYTKIGRQVFVTGGLNGATSIAVAANSILTGNLPFSASQQSTGGAVNAAFSVASVCAINVTDLWAINAIGASATIRFSATYIV